MRRAPLLRRLIACASVGCVTATCAPSTLNAPEQRAGAQVQPRTLAKPSPAPSPSPSPNPADSATSFLIDPAHAGAQPGDTLLPGLVPRQTAAVLQNKIGYPVIAGGRVFAVDAGDYGSTLWAFDAASGSWLWHFYLFGYLGWVGIAYDGGRLFSLTDSGLMRAHDPATGNQIWASQLTGNVSFSSPPTASAGVIYTGGGAGAAGGRVYAVSESSGQVIWTAPVTGGLHSSPAVTATGVYVSYSCGDTYALSPANGALLWHHAGACSGPRGRTPAVFDGKVWVRDPAGSNVVLDQATGAQLRTFPGSLPPAFHGTRVFVIAGGRLEAHDAGTMALQWTFVGDGALYIAPVVANGYVYVAGGSGKLFAVSEATGQQAWEGWISVRPLDEDTTFAPASAIAVGGGVLAAPGYGTLTLLTGGGALVPPSPAPSPSPTPAPSPRPTPSPTAGPSSPIAFAPPQRFGTGSMTPVDTWLGNTGQSFPSLVLADPANSAVEVLDYLIDGQFRDGARYDVGFAPSSVTGGTFRGVSNYADLAVAGASANKVHILLNDGKGAFSPGATIAVAGSPAHIAAADLNRDGKLDLVTANSSSGTVSTLLGNGDGTFQTAHSYPAGSNPVWVALADLDGNASPDVVVANQAADSFSVLLGDGAGGLGPPATHGLAPGSRPAALFLGDLNHDGRPDLVFGDSGTGRASVLLATGGGSFGQAVDYATGAQPSSVLAALFEFVTPSLLVANAGDGTVSLLPSNGDGTFGDAKNYPSGGSGPLGLQVSDFVGNGAPDVIVANHGSSGAAVLLGTYTADGTRMTLLPGVPSNGAHPYALVARDLNGDGQDDVAVLNMDFGSVSVFTNAGSAGLAPGHDYPTGGKKPLGIAAADLNADGKVDLVITNRDSSSLSVLLGNGDGSFLAARAFAVGANPTGVAVGDFNRDGRPDVAVADSGYGFESSDVAILLGDGYGSFRPARFFSDGTGPTSLVVADLNHDGMLDLALDGYYQSAVVTLIGNGDGTFRTPLITGNASGVETIALGDLNSDGELDAAVSGYVDATIMLGRGDGSFGDFYFAGPRTAPAEEPGLALADFNADGKLDIAVTETSVWSLAVFAGQGNGEFYPVLTLRYPDYDCPDGLVAGDFSADGRPDLVSTDYCSGLVQLAVNRASGTSASRTSASSGSTQPAPARSPAPQSSPQPMPTR